MELNVQEIQKIIPHRFPFLLIDKIIDLQPNDKLVALKNVTVNEPFFVGHFPEEKVMPGVLIIEAMAQVGFVEKRYIPPDRVERRVVDRPAVELTEADRQLPDGNDPVTGVRHSRSRYFEHAYPGGFSK